MTSSETVAVSHEPATVFQYLERAKAIIDQALAAEPEKAAYLASKGWVQFRLWNYDAAREQLQKAVPV